MGVPSAWSSSPQRLDWYNQLPVIQSRLLNMYLFLGQTPWQSYSEERNRKKRKLEIPQKQMTTVVNQTRSIKRKSLKRRVKRRKRCLSFYLKLESSDYNVLLSIKGQTQEKKQKKEVQEARNFIFWIWELFWWRRMGWKTRYFLVFLSLYIN